MFLQLSQLFLWSYKSFPLLSNLKHIDREVCVLLLPFSGIQRICGLCFENCCVKLAFQQTKQLRCFKWLPSKCYFRSKCLDKFPCVFPCTETSALISTNNGRGSLYCEWTIWHYFYWVTQWDLLWSFTFGKYCHVKLEQLNLFSSAVSVLKSE